MLQFFITPIVNSKQGNEILRNFQQEHPEYSNFAVAISPDPVYGYFMTISYKVNN